MRHAGSKPGQSKTAGLYAGVKEKKISSENGQFIRVVILEVIFILLVYLCAADLRQPPRYQYFLTGEYGVLVRVDNRTGETIALTPGGWRRVGDTNTMATAEGTGR